MNRAIAALIALCAVAAGAGAGCGTTQVLPPPPPKVSGPYRIGPQDTIEVDVWKDGSLSATMPVRPDGCITVPLVGDVAVVGKTSDEVQKEIVDRLAPTLRAPLVSVLVKDANSATFAVLGEVVHPGSFKLHGSVTMLDAIAMAGGLTPYADGDEVDLIRVGRGGESHRYTLSIKHALSGANRIPLTAGDTLYIP